MAGFVIQATGMVEFEDSLRTGVLLGGCWCPCEVVKKVPWQTKFQVCQVPRFSGIKLQLLSC